MRKFTLSAVFLAANWRFAMALFVGLVFSLGAVAQQRTITGLITDQMDESIPGVTISLRGSTTGTITNLDGRFEISAAFKDDDVLVFSFMGMKTQNIPVKGKSVIDLHMDLATIGFDEVVVVGYGSQQKKDITGAVALVGKAEIESRPNTQVSSLLQGKAAGVQVVASSGKPSQGLSLRIRGTNSINAGSEPLYVVDGVPTTDTRSLNPSDIENISILKDASSAAIYGAQGANGVVLITTRAGSSEVPVIRFDTYTGFSQVWKTLPVLNGEQYRDLMQELGQNTDWTKYHENTDWQNEIFQLGRSQNYQLSVSGKSNKTAYYVSGGWVSQMGAVRSSTMDRANFKLNLDQEVNAWLKVGARMSYASYHDVDVTDNSAVGQGGVLLGALTTPSVIGIFDADGAYTSNPFQNWENPVASTDASQRGYYDQRVLGSAFMEIKLPFDLSFKTNLGIDHSNNTYDYFLDPYSTSYGRALKGRGVYNTGKTSYYIIENTLNFAKTLGSHKIEALAGSVVQKFDWENSWLERRNFASAGIVTPNGGSEITSASASKSAKSNAAFIGRLQYDFASKYLFTANFRADGSSIFGADNRWGYFPSFSAGWRISEESFMSAVEVISDLKLRAGWGVVGNDQITNYAWFGRVGNGANYPIGGVTMPGNYPASIENRNLRWEQSEQTNVGIDLAMWNGRLRFSAEAYLKKTKDLLLNAPLPRSTGFDNAVQNVGKLENKGLEFSLNTVNIDATWKWTSDFNISFNRNKVVDLVGQEMLAGNIAGRGEASLIREGLPLGTLYGYVWGGVDPATGNAYYQSHTGGTTFSPIAADREIIGDANPDFFFGLTNTVSYKGISLQLFLQGSYGNDMLNATKIDMEGMVDPKNQSTTVLNRWRNPGDITSIPKVSWGNTNNSRISTRFVEDASYVRVKSLTLSYDIPTSVLEQIHLKGLKVYVSGENLLTFTQYSGFDPEVNAFGNNNTVKGIDYGTYPQTRNLILGLNLTF